MRSRACFRSKETTRDIGSSRPTRLSRSRCRKACSASHRAGAPAHRPDHDLPRAVLGGGPEGRPHPRERGRGRTGPFRPLHILRRCPERKRTTTMPCFDARALETDPDGLALLREVLGPPKVCASFGPETHARLTRDEGGSFSGLEARKRAGVALRDPPPQAPEGLPSSDRPGDVIGQDGRPEIGRVVEGPTPLVRLCTFCDALSVKR